MLRVLKVNLDMDKTIEDKPLYRFFNVVLFLAYFFVVLIVIFAGYLGYSNRKTISASVKCQDGTTWNALQPKDILYDSGAACGLCTKRSVDGTKYQNCEYGSIDYSSYNFVEKKESWSWSTITYPLIAFVVGFGVVDFIRLMILYIFTGKMRFDKSLLLKILVLLSSSEKNEV